MTEVIEGAVTEEMIVAEVEIEEAEEAVVLPNFIITNCFHRITNSNTCYNLKEASTGNSKRAEFVK
jgi:CYTH domain-containing protein